MPKLEIRLGEVVYTDGKYGAVLDMNDERWHPFRYFDSGGMDVHNDGFITPSGAYKMAKMYYT